MKKVYIEVLVHKTYLKIYMFNFIGNKINLFVNKQPKKYNILKAYLIFFYCKFFTKYKLKITEQL